MKRPVARIIAASLFGVLALGSMTQAQPSERVIKANVPFEFGVGDQTFPAGTYLVVSTDPGILAVRDAAGHTLATVLTNAVETLQTPAAPKLKFSKESGRYALVQVWQGNFSIGQQLPSGKASEKAAKRQSRNARTIAAGGPR